MKYFSVFWVIAFIVTGVSYAADPALQALIVDGQNNHNWKGTTPILKTYLEETGLFEVEVATTGERYVKVSTGLLQIQRHCSQLQRC